MPEAGNLFAALDASISAEEFTPLIERAGVRIERIVSLGQTTPADEPLVQAGDEWVVLLAGSAGLRLDGEDERALVAGDHLLIPGGTHHWVTRTDMDLASVWLAVHLE